MHAFKIPCLIVLGTMVAALVGGTAQPTDCPPQPSSPCLLTGHQDDVHSVDFHPDGDLLASGSRDGTVKLWTVPSGALARTIEETGQVNAVRFSPNGNALAVASARLILRRVSDGDAIWRSSDVLIRDDALAFSPDGELIATSGPSDTVQVFGTAEGNVVQTLRGPISRIMDVAFSPTENVLASASRDGRIMLWDVETGEALRTLEDRQNRNIPSLAFGPDGDRLAALTRPPTEIVVWEIATGQRALRIEPRGASFEAIAWGPTGRFLAATPQRDGEMVVYDVPFGGFSVQRLKAQRGTVWSVDFSPNGSFLATGAQDWSVMMADLSGLRE